MFDSLEENLNLLDIVGITVGVANAGLYQPSRNDVTIIKICHGANTVAVFTQNAFCAAPVVIAKRHLNNSAPRYFLINTKNANAGTGEEGLSDALSCTHLLATLTNCPGETVLPFSTGVIGESFPVEQINGAIPKALDDLTPNGWSRAAAAILTTDTKLKATSTTFQIDGVDGHITGIAKGSGMINPNMATMLAFIATDICIEQSLLQQCLEEAVSQSFNCITVDGDTSTNDACTLSATGKIEDIKFEGDYSEVDLRVFQKSLNDVCISLAKAIVMDGEGATKFMTIDVQGGASTKECKDIGKSIANSPLVKTAFFASDPNWGRLLAAIGKVELSGLDVNKISIFLNDVCIVYEGRRFTGYSEEKGYNEMIKKEVVVLVKLGRGDSQSKIWTCDFSYDYIKINAEYRT